MEELIDALENRLEHGEDKESLRAEVLAAGYSNEVFEEAFLEANRRYQMSGGGEDSEATFADTVEEEEFKIPHTRARGDLYTLQIGRTKNSSGLIGYTDMLKQGWQIGRENTSLLGGLFGSLVLLVVALAVAVLLIGLYVTSDLFVDNTTTLLVLIGLCGTGYLVAILYASIAGFAFFRGLLMRTEQRNFWPHFWWGWRHIIPIFLLSFYIQIITQAGLILFILPGLIAMIYLGYAQYVLAKDEVRGLGAMIQSFELVYGRFWAILGRKLFLIATFFVSVLVEVMLLAIFPLLGVVGLFMLFVVFYIVFCASISLYESVSAAKPIHTFNEHDTTIIKRWLMIVISVGLLFGAFSFFGMVSTIDPSQEYPEVDKFIHLVRDAKETSEKPEEVLDTKDTNAAQISLITSYIDEVQLTADIYKENNGSYAGVCSDEEGVNTLLRYAYDSGANDIFCHDNRGWYIAEAELGNSGTYYCVDSTGNSLVQQNSRNGYETCINQ